MLVLMRQLVELHEFSQRLPLIRGASMVFDGCFNISNLSVAGKNGVPFHCLLL
jgi:hypothetical protein